MPWPLSKDAKKRMLLHMLRFGAGAPAGATAAAASSDPLDLQDRAAGTIQDRAAANIQTRV